MKKNRLPWQQSVLAILLSFLLFLVDLITKYYVLRDLKPIGTFTIIPGLLEFSYVENRAAAFGLFGDVMWLVCALIIVAVVVLLGTLFFYRNHTIFSKISVPLILSGGVGNFVDRLRYGFVVDFIHVNFFDFVFNFADCCVTVGACLLVVHAFALMREEKKLLENQENADHE